MCASLLKAFFLSRKRFFFLINIFGRSVRSIRESICQSRFFLSLLEVDYGPGGSDSSAPAKPLRPVLLPVTRLAIQLHIVGSHVLELQHLIAQIAFEASFVVLVVADFHLFCHVNRSLTLATFGHLRSFKGHLGSLSVFGKRDVAFKRDSA